MVIQHKCENCGDDMVFDADSGMLMCPSCGNKKEISNDEKLDESSDSTQEETQFSKTKRFSSEESGKVNEFICKNCGAVLMTDALTTSTRCSFCDSPMVIGDRLTGELAPSYVVPFKISKEAAKVEFDKWRKKAWFAPSGFKKMARLKELAGQYVPFWLYILNSRGELYCTGVKIRTYSRGDYVYTEKKYYDVYRKYDIDLRGIPADASKKMDDEVMDKLEPFKYEELEEFDTSYLAGYLAEKYDYNDEQMYPRVKERAEKYTNEFVDGSLKQYDSTTSKTNRFNVYHCKSDYVLLPIWMFNYNYKDKDYMFTMNAQTGKVVGRPPISIPKTVLTFLCSTVGVTLLMRLLAFMMGGDFL